MEILSTFWFQTIIKLILGFILAGIIGAERQSLNKPAGFKTHSLIGISAVLIMLCGEYLSKTFDIDASRIPAQLLSGIGFIGAGTILTDGFNVKGLTTAASLLAVTCIGLSIGAGFYLGGIFATIFVYIVLSYSNNLFNKQDSLLPIELIINIKDSNLSQIEKIFSKYKFDIIKIVNLSEDEEKVRKFKFICKHSDSINLNKFLFDISNLNNVSGIESN